MKKCCTPGRAAVAVGALIASGLAAPTATATAEPTDPAERAVADPRPNIVVVLADDLGYNDLGSSRFGPGNRFNRTPELDRLARDGTVFTNAYSSPSCSPTRMALLSGLLASDPDNYSFQVGPLYGKQTGRNATPLRGIRQGPRLDDATDLLGRTTTVAEVARSAGYRTTYAGKFHATRSAGAIETQHGFDRNYGGLTSGDPGRYHASGGVFGPKVGPGLDRDGYARPYTRAYVEENIAPYSRGLADGDLARLVGKPKNVNDALGDVMEDRVGVGPDPTFTFVGHYTVHSPVDRLQARPDLRAKYDRRLRGNQDPDKVGYAGLIENMDQTMGRLRDHLLETEDPRDPGRSLAQNTVVVFLSDNGGRTQTGADNRPLAGQKFETTEGGVRVPFLAWSGNEDLVRSGRVDTSVVRNIDLMPTVLDYTGARAPVRQEVAGRSLAPAFAGRAIAPAANVVHLPGYYRNGDRDARPTTTLRQQDGWKLTYTYEDRSFRLHDLDADPGETTNLRRRRPSVAEPIARRMIDYLDRYAPGLPTLRRAAGRFTIRELPPGTRLYRNGAARTLRARRDLVVRPGTEIPVVLRPGFRR